MLPPGKMLIPNYYDFEPVSVIVIGYNEAENLERTMTAIKAVDYPEELIELIYVDSGSTDDSVAIANRYTDKIFLEPLYPSPGRNRNRGLVEASHSIVHFVDGDVEIDRDYLKNAIPLFKRMKVKAVVGQLDEINPNLFNRLSTLSNVPKTEGYTNFTSTGATYEQEALLSINGYDERLRRGEEAELGYRFRGEGYKIWCSTAKMGKHNFGINNIFQYLKKFKANAISLVQAAKIEGEGEFFRASRKRFRGEIYRTCVLSMSIVMGISIRSWQIPVLVCFVIAVHTNRRYIPKLLHSKLIALEFLISVIGYAVFNYWFNLEAFGASFCKSKKVFYLLKKEELQVQVRKIVTA